MRKTILFIFLLVSAHVKGQWIELTPDTNFFHEGMFFNSTTKGIAVGLNGVYQQTFDGGSTWDTSYIQLDDWSLCTRSPYASDLRCVYFPSDTIGYIGGQDGDLFKTNNGGQSWHCINCLGYLDDVEQLYFFNNDTGLAASWWTLWRTTDGGATWNYFQPPFYPTRMTPVNDSTVLMGGAKIWRSTDYGLTWAPTNCDTTIGFHDISMGDSLHGVAVAWAGKVIRTTDGGLNWSAPTQIATVRISNVEMLNDKFGYITLGDSWQTNWQQHDMGYVMYTLDGGITWIQPDTIGTKTMTDLQFPDDSTGFVCGWLGNLMKTEHPVHPVSTIGIEEPPVAATLLTFPNPVDDILYVSLPGYSSVTEAIFTITDISGRVVKTEQALSIAPYMIDVAGLSSGVYFLHCTTNGIESTSKFIVQ